jgi:hypothetical protein
MADNFIHLKIVRIYQSLPFGDNMLSFVVKVAFIYTAERMTYLHGSKYAPTYRVSIQLVPTVKNPHFTAAISELGKDGSIRPRMIYKPVK